MYYSRPTLISNWHKNREAEPKDYDFTACPPGKRTLHKSTYNHFGTCVETSWSTTTETQMSQYLLKKQYEIRETPRSMVRADNFRNLVFDRETGQSRSVLPRHGPGHNNMDFRTTYTSDYQPQKDAPKDVMETESAPNISPDFRRRQSVFTDVADHRRRGKNTWQDVNEMHDGMDATTRKQFSFHTPTCP
ncbi:protein C9orf135-like [Chanos chanos]|uniref:Protein C9orf135-like n=1 Tax=Chanos chanos TaxID=29144 RepID=A0A6J2WTS8_CHACN|nr:protein C9orf135 homolog [Chanos chanos]